MESVLVDVRKKKAVLTATNLNITICYEMECESAKTFKLLLPFAELLNITKVLGDIPVEITNENSSINLQAGFDVFKLGKSDDPVNYPKLDEFTDELEFEATPDFFWSMQQAGMMRLEDKNEMVFNNICVKVKGETIDVVGTDKNRLFLQTFPIKTGKLSESLVDGEFLKALKNVQAAKVKISDKFFCVEADDVTMYVKLTDQKYAKYEMVTSTLGEINCTVPKDELKTALNKILVYKSAHHTTLFSFSKDKISLSFNDADFSREVKTEVIAEHTVEIECISLNAALVLSILNLLPDDCKLVKWNVTSPTRAVFFIPDTDDSVLTMLMPLFQTN